MIFTNVENTVMFYSEGLMHLKVKANRWHKFVFINGRCAKIKLLPETKEN